ncbi:hypothetical protein M569_02493, partial [Genlisea aurea]
LKKKYLEECSKRKKLFNEVIELKGNIRVFCRCRPMKEDEIAKGSTSVVDFSSSQENELHIICSDSSKKQFKFDHVFRPEVSQDAVFEETLPLVTSVLDGFNVCIFAYGQTGTGKTYTMEGTPENRGVNYRTLETLFRMSEERCNSMKFELFVSMLEVYNEKIKDLLVESSNQPAKKLEIKQSAEGNQEVPGLVEACVHGTDEVWGLLKAGSQIRSVGSTNSNEQSSRSHCLVRVTVVGENLFNGQRTKSHLWLVDLAGCERLSRIDAEGERLKESQFINKSLSALGDVISALASKSSHVPYRNSKLTHMLQSSLGGDCKTLMFVQISPNIADLGETLCSLNFASRVRGVEHGPAKKQLDLNEIFKQKQLAEKAKQDEENKKLQESVQSLQLRLAAREHIHRTLQTKVRDLENQLAEERKTRLKQQNRALASSVSALSSTKNSNSSSTDNNKRPPLPPSQMMRVPLRGITNMMPVPSKKTRMSYLPPVREEKENAAAPPPPRTKNKVNLKARRGSIAIRPSVVVAHPSVAFQPRRRASMATELISSSLATPLQHSSRIMGRQSFVWDPQRVWKASRASSPVETAVEAATPTLYSSSKFRGSPPVNSSWKPKHPTVVALQKKLLVWSPLRMK